ncbi:MAG: helix-turn-helix transcriptional regulator [Clostridia bacterium]|nr:helix-turn-helix transcriptional regulator [Clostridia bacterium]
MKKYFKYKLQNLINVSEVVALHYLEFGKNFKTKGESHDFWELVYAEKESLICTADGREIPLMQGEILFHRPGEFHTLAANGQTAPSAFVLCFVCRSDAMAFFENRKLRLEKRLVKLLYSIWEEGKRTFDIPYSDMGRNQMRLLQNPTLGGEQLIKNYLEIFLIDLLRYYTETDSGNDIFLQRNELSEKPVKEVLHVLEGALYESLSIDDICEKTAYGRAYLFRVFKASTGRTIMEYYTSLKIEKAKQLLRENELSVKEIAERLCFNEANYFTKTFKRVTGLTPMAYRRRCNEMNL